MRDETRRGEARRDEKRHIERRAMLTDDEAANRRSDQSRISRHVRAFQTPFRHK